MIKMDDIFDESIEDAAQNEYYYYLKHKKFSLSIKETPDDVNNKFPLRGEFDNIIVLLKNFPQNLNYNNATVFCIEPESNVLIPKGVVVGKIISLYNDSNKKSLELFLYHAKKAAKYDGSRDSYLYLCGLLIRNQDIMIVNNFLLAMEAMEMRALTNIFPPGSWMEKAIYPSYSGPVTVYFPCNKTKEIYEAENIARIKAGNGEFSYSFSRTRTVHVNNCCCILCYVTKLFQKEETKNLLSALAGHKIANYGETFLSHYGYGDYLTIHHDKNKGDYTFILSLTDNWLWTDGGLTIFLNKDKTEVKKVLSPIFGCLTVFKVEKDETTHHFVTEVTAHKSRYTFTGWFNVEH